MNAVQDVEASALTGEAKAFWEEKQKFLLQHAEVGKNAENIQQQRENFIYVSEALIKTVAAFGVKGESLYVDYCPMANSDKGAYWLSGTAEIRNPYYGEAMLKCGEIVEQLN